MIFRVFFVIDFLILSIKKALSILLLLEFSEKLKDSCQVVGQNGERNNAHYTKHQVFFRIIAFQKTDHSNEAF